MHSFSSILNLKTRYLYSYTSWIKHKPSSPLIVSFLSLSLFSRLNKDYCSSQIFSRTFRIISGDQFSESCVNNNKYMQCHYWETMYIFTLTNWLQGKPICKRGFRNLMNRTGTESNALFNVFTAGFNTLVQH